MTEREAAGQVGLIFGVGPGLGAALARRFSRAGMRIGVAARHLDKLRGLAGESSAGGAEVRPYACDVGSEKDVIATFDAAASDLGPPDLVVYNAGTFRPGKVMDIDAGEFEHCWRVGCYGGFLVGRESARRMSARRSGTILFTGATASLRGGAGFANLAVGKFGLRALAQSMARELGPQGIHVGHVVIDGQILSDAYVHPVPARTPDSFLDPNAIAEEYFRLHLQDRSAWTLELDLRPWVERF